MAGKYLDNDGVLYLWNKVKSHVSSVLPTKTSDLTNDSNFAVDSSYVHTDNNYTTTEKNKLSGIASGAQVNVIESVKVNGTALTVTSKAVDVSVPTATSDLTNDSGFITSADVPEGASASTAIPLMDGTAAVGTSTAFARGDHVHPSDTSKQNVLTFDTTPTEGSDNPVTSAGIYTAFTLAAQMYQPKEAGKGLSTNDYTNTEKEKLAAFSSASSYALKSDITNMYKYKGSVATVSALPSSGQTAGDVYNVEASGMNYAWNGSAWDALGEIFTITAITNSELDTICT